MTEYGTVIDKRNLATAQSVSNLNGRVNNLSKTTDDVKDIAESALKVATIEYAIGTETEATGEWQALTPKPSAGEFVWQRVTVTTGAGKTTQTTSLIQNIAALAQSTADTAVTDAATAQSTADTAKEKADTATASAKAAQSTADTAVTNAAAAQSTAEAAQSTADTAKENAASAQTAAEAAQSTADTAQTTADSASSAASSAQSAASKAQKTADTATTNAAAAQSTADTAKADAATAQSTADTAKADAATAQSTADTAKADAATAQSTADDAKTLAAKTNQHFWTDDYGAHITTTAQGEAISGGNTSITGEGMDVRDGNTTLASFKKDGVVIGANNTQKIGITDKAFEAANAEGKIAARISSEYGMEVITETEGIFDPSMTGTLVLSFAPVAGSAITVSDNGSSVTFTQGTAETKAMTTEFGTYTITYDGDRTFTGTTYAKFTYRSSQSNGKVLSLADGAISAKWNGNFYARKVYSRDFSMRGQSLTDLFSGTISIGTTSTGALSISAGGNTGDTGIEVNYKDGYNARCIVGWNMSGTGASNCMISKLYINQSKRQIHYYIKNTGSAKATPTLKAYVLYTKNN